MTSTNTSQAADHQARDHDEHAARAARKRKMIDRVQKLLTLAADPAATDEERQSAYAKAADLMTRHGIEEAQLAAGDGRAPESIETHRYEASNTAKHGKARIYAAGSIAQALGCKGAYFYLGQQRTCYVMIVGAASDIETLRTLLPLVMGQAEHAAVTATATHASELRRKLADDWTMSRNDINNLVRAARTRFYRSFLTGYGSAVASRIRDRRRDMVTEAQSTGTGAELVLVDREHRVGAEFTKQFPKLGKPRAARYSEAGLRAGREQGRRADLGDNHVTTGERTAIGA